jgi:hypothetical protein
MKEYFISHVHKIGGALVRGVVLLQCVALAACTQADVPDPRNAKIPTPMLADERQAGVNEKPDPVLYLPLGRDVLVPEISTDDPLPEDIVGPFELRSETLAGALQLILSDYDISLAFESDEGLTRTVTIANLRGPLNKVVRRVCGLADLYCAYEDGLMIVKDTQTFTVKIPPISSDTGFITSIASGLSAIIGQSATVDSSTRTIVYEATQRTAERADRYFQRVRASTALIVFETYIWEVSLDSGNSTGIRWDMVESIGRQMTTGFDINGSVGADFTNPVSIGLPTTKTIKNGGEDGDGSLSAREVFNFLSRFGAVKTISQPQITVLSGSTARLRAVDTENFVSEISETLDNGQTSTSVDTQEAETGFTLEIESAWDNATVYANVNIELNDVSEIEDFDFSTTGGGTTTIQLPKSTVRELETQIRVRPGDSVLIAGLVRETDQFNSQGPGGKKPWFPSSRTATTANLELVFLLKPRVIVYTSPSESEQFNSLRGSEVKTEEFEYDFSPLVGPDGGQQMGVPMGSLSSDVLNPGQVSYGSF